MKRLLAIFMVIALMLSLVACGGSQQISESHKATPQGSTSTGGEEAPAEPVTLRMITWVQETNERAIAELNQKFSEKYPNVSFVVDTVNANDYPTLQNTRISAGDVDIITNLSAFDTYPQDFTKGADLPAWVTFIESGAYLDITDQPFIKNWDPNMIENAVSYKGRVYGLDMGAVGFNGVFYNKDIFEQYGFEEPGTWAEFEVICNTLKENGISPITVGADAWPLTSVGVSAMVGAYEPDMNEFAKGLWTGTRKFTDERCMELWKRFEQLVLA